MHACLVTTFVISSAVVPTAPGGASPPPTKCTVDAVGQDFPYGDLKMLTGVDQDACCAACMAEGQCVRWVFSANDTTGGHVPHCWLKDGTHKAAAARPDRISGPGTPSPPPAPPTPTTPWSAKYRGWHYYTGGAFGGFVVPPVPVMANGSQVVEGCQLVDCAVAWEADQVALGSRAEDAQQFRMFYTIFDGTGYRTALATSADLLAWDFSPGVVFDRGASPAAFDYGGVTFGCPLWANASVTSPRRMQQVHGRTWVAYGAYPTRGGYEQGNGGEGMAWSNDSGRTWHRESATVPFVGGATAHSATWESRVVYQPNLVLHNNTVYDFYNAAGVNAAQVKAEQSGVATLKLDAFPGVDTGTNTSLWSKYSGNPIIPSGPAGSYDTGMASDPKVFFDDELGCWVMFYFGLGDASSGHADIMMARSFNLLQWEKDPVPLYKAGGHPNGIDAQHAHKISLIYHNGTGFLYYTAVGPKGRGIALLTSQPLPAELTQDQETVNQ